jgi:uncharacterized repeat protein (TIGR02543 family)
VEYSIEYDLGTAGVSNHADNPDKYTVNELPLALHAPSGSAGATFLGWYENSSYSGEPVASIPQGTTVNKHFYAKWTAITITFKDGDGTVIQTGPWDYNTMPSYTCATPTKTATAQSTYTWDSAKPWSPAIAPATKAATYEAQFTEAANTPSASQFTAGPSINLTPGNGQLAWTITDSDPVAENYDVYRVSGSETDTATVKGGTRIEDATLTGTITGLTNEQVYSVIVTAHMSGYADSDSAIVLAAPVQYAIGDTGPAGGKIFYVKSVPSDGWRYLEASPADLAYYTTWGVADEDVPGTALGIGTGQQNTAAIVNKYGGGSYAANHCDNYVYGGFNDWFLPSKDELKEMCEERSSVGISSDNRWYWSSSQFSNTNSWYQSFAGFGGVNPKSTSRYIRAVRSF